MGRSGQRRVRGTAIGRDGMTYYCRRCEGQIEQPGKHICLDIESGELLRYLKRVEWCKWEGVDFVSYKCPCCGNYRQQKHLAGCETERRIQALEGI